MVLIEDEDLLIICTAAGFDEDDVSFGTVRAFRASTGQQVWVYQTTFKTTGTGPNVNNSSGVNIFANPAVDTKTGRIFVGTGQNNFVPEPQEENASDLQDSFLCLNYRTTSPEGHLLWWDQYHRDDISRYPAGGECFYSGGKLKKLGCFRGSPFINYLSRRL